LDQMDDGRRLALFEENLASLDQLLWRQVMNQLKSAR